MLDSYRRQAPEGTPAERSQVSPGAPVHDASRLLRRLLPYPGAPETLSSLSIPPLSPRGGRAQEGLLPGVVPRATGQQPAAIVSEAASILDEEMAKGVLAARGASQGSRDRAFEPGRTLLRQVHDLVDNVAGIWPTLQGASALSPVASQAEASRGDPLPELKPAFVVRPGQRARIATALRNKEDHAVRLVPASTDLVSGSGGRIPARLLEFVPAEIRLEAGEQAEIEIATTVPADTLAGCYFGLLVVGGVDDLRALITIDVTSIAAASSGLPAVRGSN
jgi:hypothetical protein